MSNQDTDHAGTVTETTCPPYAGGSCNPHPPTSVVTMPPSSPPTSPPNEMPFTGADIIGLALIGTVAAAVGAIFARARRHARA